MHFLKSGASKRGMGWASLMHGELTDRLEKEIIEEVIMERIEAGGDAAVAVEFLLILRGLVQSVCLILRLVIPSHPNGFCFSLQRTLLAWRLGSFSLSSTGSQKPSRAKEHSQESPSTH